MIQVKTKVLISEVKAERKKAEEYLPQFCDPEKYIFDGSDGNNFIFSYFSGDVPTYDSVCISLLDNGSLNAVRHFTKTDLMKIALMRLMMSVQSINMHKKYCRKR